MKKLVFAILGIGLLAGLNSCSEDFAVAAPYKNITFVYGFLNAKDTAHYVRIQKAFLDDQKSAIDMAKEADSNFYNSLDVKIKEINPNILPPANPVVNTITLNRVDLANEGYPKDTGGFFNSPSYAYKFKNTLNPAYKYRLVVTNMQSGHVDSSEINIIDPATFKSQQIMHSQFKLFFAKTMPVESQKSFFTVSNSANAQYLEAIVKFSWVEKDLNNGTSVRKSANFSWESLPRTTGAETIMRTSNIRFYSFFRDVMQPAPSGVSRFLDSADIYIYGGGVDYYNYLQSKFIQSGLTADQAKPVFTNIYGKDVYGLFTTRCQIVRLNVPIDSLTMDSLKVNPITADLNIKGVADE